jgi:hypothetical protein
MSTSIRSPLTATDGAKIYFTGTSACDTWAPTIMGMPFTIGGNTYAVSKNAKPKKAPMRDPVPCPKCGGLAVTDDDGNDAVLQLHDYRKDADGVYVPTDIVARIRVCVECSHLWATVVKPVEK